MSLYDNVQFKIINIKTERTPNGFTVIEFVTAEDSMIDGCMNIKLPNPLANDKRQVKAFMMGEYHTRLNNMARNENIKVGDII